MIGAANAEPIATIFEEGSRVDRTMRFAGQYLTNVTTSNFGAVFSLASLPTNRGDKKLHINNCAFRVNDADVANYIDYVKIYGMDKVGGRTEEWVNNANRTAAVDFDESVTLTSGDMGGYTDVTIMVYCIVATQGNLDFTHPVLDCYYD